MEMDVTAKSQFMNGQGYKAIIVLNGLVVWTDKEVFNNHVQAETVANEKLIDTIKKLFNDTREVV